MSKKGSFLGKHERLLERLERSRGKNKSRKVNDSNSRSYDERKAESDRRQAEYRANQDRYRGDFEIVGGVEPGVAYSQVVTDYYNPETGATWSAPHSGYKPKEGTGWVKGYGPKNDDASDKPVAFAKEAPTKGSKFEAMLRERMRKF